MPFIIIFLVLAGVTIWAWWRIFGRVGWSPWLSLLTWLPIINIIVLVAFALARWPIDRGPLVEPLEWRDGPPMAGRGPLGHVSRYCTSCGTGNVPDARYCTNCGTPMGDA